MSKEYYLNFGLNNRYYFSLPSTWTPIYVADTEDHEEVKSPAELIQVTLSQEQVASSLHTLSSRASRVAIIVDDNTRPTPIDAILPAILSELTKYGVDPQKITLVVACGTHVAMDRSALETRFGNEILSRYNVVQHNATQADLIPLKLPDGRIVKINPVVAAANVKIGISSILPHPMAGYGGGPKIVMPGVCNLEFIMHHHMTHTVHPRSNVGITAGNPFYEDCMNITRQIGLDFSFNCVYDKQGRIVRIVAGTLEEAFREAEVASIENLAVTFKEKVDITLTSSYPHTHGIQLFKGLTAPDIITKPQGAILLVAPLVTPIPDLFIDCFLKTKAASGGNASDYITGIMAQGKPFLPDKSAEYNMAMSSALRRPPIRTILVSNVVTGSVASALGFEYASSIDEGIALLKATYQEAQVAIFPSGGLILPLL